MDKGIRIR